MDTSRFLRLIRAQLQDGGLTGPIDPNSPEGPSAVVVPLCSVRIIRRILIVSTQDILDIFDRDLAVRLAAPWNEETPWILLHFWIEKTLDIPSSRRIVMAVLILLAAKSIARIEALVRVIKIEMVFLDKVFKIWMTEEVLSLIHI